MPLKHMPAYIIIYNHTNMPRVRITAEQKKENKKQYEQKNKVQIAERRKQYREANKEKVAEQNKQHKKKYRAKKAQEQE